MGLRLCSLRRWAYAWSKGWVVIGACVLGGLQVSSLLVQV